MTPYNEANIISLEHATMCLNFLSAAADVVDFLEYASNSEILERVNLNI